MCSSDLCAAAFVDDPFTNGDKLYRTGDMARFLYDGRIEYLGRKDHQVKLYGQRIELEEITGGIMNTGLVFDAAVHAVKNTDDGAVTALRGFVVPHETKPFYEAELRRELAKMLPAYMIPAEFIIMDVIPLTVTGKTDFNALSSAADSGKTGPQKQGAPQSPQHAKEQTPTLASDQQDPEPVYPDDREAVRPILQSLWKDVLAAENIDDDRSFFEQGGSSLSAMNLLIRYFKYGWKMKLNVLYENPSLEEQLNLICEKYGDSQAVSSKKDSPLASSAAPPITRDRVESPLITGATGFLGAHIVCELLRRGTEELYCLIRGDITHFWDTMNHFFGAAWVAENAGKIHLVAGDICKSNLGLEDSAYEALAEKISAVYHSAADVRHYAQEDAVMETNVAGTKNVIAFCKCAGAVLGYTSTLSVGGEKILPEHRLRYHGLAEVEFDETCSDIGQNWTDNVYVRSKFFAELEVRQAVKEGLSAKILRIGRLVGRTNDGMFQQNRKDNYFYNVITGMARLGAVPEDVYNARFELTPVDSCARAVVTAMESQMDVLHISNPHAATLGLIIETLAQHPQQNSTVEPQVVQLLDEKEYTRLALDNSAVQPLQIASILNSSLALADKDDIKVEIECAKSNEALEQLGFVWEKPRLTTVLRAFFLE